MRFDEPDRARHVLATGPAAEALHVAHLVIADAVDVVLVDTENSVVNEELPDVRIPIGEDPASDIGLVCEIEAEVLVGCGLEIEEVDALGIKAAG